MSCYLFQNKNVYIFMDGRVECVLWDDLIASSMREDRNAHILIAEADGPLLIEHVRQIRQAFPRGGIKTCVAYAIALRMFLQKHGLIATGESFLVADDLGDKFLLTASNHQQMAVTRAILSHDPGKVVDEIRRTQKNEPILRILSNSSQVIEALDAERKKEAVFFEASFPVFEVLGKVKFPAQLMSPEECLMQKKSVMRRGLIAAWVMAVLMASAGAICFSYAQAKESSIDRKMMSFVNDKAELDREYRELVVRTYQGKLKGLPVAPFFEVFAKLFNCLPPDSLIENITLQREFDKRWRFTSLISFPRQEITPFMCDGAFKEANLEHIFIRARPGLKIEYALPGQAKGVSRL